MTENEIIQGCKEGSRKAQKALFERYSGTMLGVARRYSKTWQDAEDVLLLAFEKVFRKIDQYGGGGSFEGWIRRIVVNEGLMLIRKQEKGGTKSKKNTAETTKAGNKLFIVNLESFHTEVPTKETAIDELSAQEILDLLEKLPEGCREIFNMYVLDGMKHREIAEAKGISINTSKSQLLAAKAKLQQYLEELGFSGLEGYRKSG